MNILLLNAGSFCVNQTAIMPLGLISVATHLENIGHKVRLIDRAVEKCNMRKQLAEFRPDIVGVSAITFMSFSDAKKISKQVKQYGIPVVWGGQIPSLVPDLILNSGLVDYVVVGDGEIVMEELLQATAGKRSLRNIDGLVFVEDGQVVFNAEREPVDLAQLPILNFSFVDPEKYIVRNARCDRSLHIYSSKGCPGQCTYCYSSCFSKRKWRARPLAYVLSEIRWLQEHYCVDGVYFADDLISPNSGYLAEFCETMRKSGLDFYWGCNLRADSCTREELQMLYDAGCRWMFFGIESGSPERQKSIKKNLNLEKAKKTIHDCRDIGIAASVSFIVGYPDETREELKQTIRYMRGLDADVTAAGIFGVIPKSELFEYLVKTNRLEAPGSLREWEKLRWLNKIDKNFSAIPNLHLKVVANRTYYDIIFSKQTKDKEQVHFWFKRLLGQAVGFLKQATLKSVFLFVLSGIEFLKIVFYARGFPWIVREYGMDKK